MAKYGGYNFNVKRVAPMAINTPHFSFSTNSYSKAPSYSANSFKWGNPYKGNGKNKAWQDIEAATGKQFGSYEEAIGYLAGQASKKGGGHSVFGGIGNLLGDAKDAIVGLPIGIWELNKAAVKDIYDVSTGDFNFSNTAKIAKAIGQNYEDTYGPAFHGHWGKFLDNLYQHPLGPILDVASVATLGAGGVVRAGGLLAKVGEETSAIARAGRALEAAGKSEPLLARSQSAIRAGADASEENALAVRFTSRNPVIRAKQKFIFNKMQNPTVPLLKDEGRINSRLAAMGRKLEERRYASKSLRLKTHEDYARRYEAVDAEHGPAILGYDNAFSSLNKFEKAAANIIGLIGSHSEGGLKGFVERTKVQARDAGSSMPRDLERLWLHPKTQKAYDEGVAALKSGNTENKVAKTYRYAEQLGIVNARHKGLSPEEAATRSWSTLARNHATKQTISNVTREVLADHPEWNPNEAGIKDAEARVRAEHLRKEVDDRITNMYRAQVEGRGASLGDIQHYHEQMAKYTHDLAEARRLRRKRPTPPEYPANALARNEVNPIYIPHRTGIDKKHGSNARLTTNNAGEATAKLTHRNLGVVQAMGRIAIGEDLLGKEFARTLRTRHAMDIRNAMVAMAVEVSAEDVMQMQANGYHMIKAGKRNFMAETAQAQLNKIFKEADSAEVGWLSKKMDDFFLVNDMEAKHPGAEIAEKRNGKYLMISDRSYKHLRQEYVESSKIIKNFVEKPLGIWKYVVLGLVPRNFITNVVGNSLMSALLAHGPIGAMRILFHSAVKTMTPEDITRVLTFGHKAGVTDRFMQRWFPEQWQASFTHGEMNLHGRARQLAVSYRGAHRNEIALRQGMLMDLIHNEPAIRAERRKGGSWEEAAARALEKDPHLRDELAERVDDALGNYREFTNAERRAKNFMPFYSWYRHSARNMKAMSNRPTTLAAGYRLGQYGSQVNAGAFPNVPEYMKAFIPFGDRRGAMQGGINTAGMNPYQAIVEMGDAVKQLAFDKDKTGATGKVASFLNPFIGASVEEATGTSLLTGAPSPTPKIPGLPNAFMFNVPARILMSTPQVRAAGTQYDSSFGSKPSGADLLTPTGRLKKPKVNTLSKGSHTQWLNFMGFPVKDVNIPAAQEWQKKLETDTKFHMPKPRKKKKKPYGPIDFKF